MTHSPPIPDANTSPYPRQEPPHEAPSTNLPVVRKDAATRKPPAALGAVGTAIVAGVAALVGGLLLWRRRR